MKGGMCLGTKKSETPSRKEVTREIWLLYFNQYLFKAGLITETERNKMILKIKASPKL